MSIEDVVELNQNEVNSEQGPGVQLQRAREHLRLSQADIARQLKLKISFVDAIESNDYTKLPAPTFVRGYLRSYARVVNLPGDEVIHMFNQLINTQKAAFPVPPPMPAKPYKDKVMHEKTLRITTVAIVGVLIALFFIGWYTEYTSTSRNDTHALPPMTTVVKPTITTVEKPITTPPPVKAAAGPAVAAPPASAPAPAKKVVDEDTDTDTDSSTSDITPPSEN